VTEQINELLRGARSRLLAGDLAGARELIESAARAWRTAGNAVEEGRCLRLASALARHDGRPAVAVDLAAKAVAAAPVGASYAEAGKAALAAGDPEAAVHDFAAALADDPAAEFRAVLEQGYAGALIAAGRGPDALAAYRRAAALAPGPDAAIESLLDGVGQLQAAGEIDLAEALAGDADRTVTAHGAHGAASGLAILAAARALDRGDPHGARIHAERARSAALAGRGAAEYVAAATAVAAIADATGDRVGAYASLAVGWVTLRDLVGAEPARAAFEPTLLALRERWGAADFAAVKTTYETRVRKP
jgi:tetratricopeptide (TPR) repeat protein